MANGDLVIITRGLSKHYQKVRALTELDLVVPRKSIFGFLGPNGAGKTTTIKLLLGLTDPSAGSATVFGHDITRNSLEIRRRIGYLAQNPRYYPHLTARETLEFTARFFYRGSAKGIKRRVDESLELVGLIEKADRPIKGFSGGELQRLGLAQAQVNHPDLLILDEPVASLDPEGRRDVLDVMVRLREHTTIFYSTHILDDVQRVSDVVAILNQGKLITQAPVEELLRTGAEAIFSIALKGESPGAYQRVISQPWVSGITVSTEGEYTIWKVSVTQPEIAESQLIGLIVADQRVTVTAFKQQQPNLEDMFLKIIGDARNV